MNSAMEYDQSFIQAENRCDFLVTEKRKKVWYIELKLLKRFDEVCKKYHLSYYIDYGTLLGAVRHKGFIPWDDDIDVSMFRDDYAKLQKIAPGEFKEPYFYQDSYTSQPVPIWNVAKIHDNRTTAIQFPNAPLEMKQGLCLDVFPIDDAPDGQPSSEILFEMKREIWMSIVEPDTMRKHLQMQTKFLLEADILYDLLKLPAKERFRQFEDFNLSNFGKSKNVGNFTDVLYYPERIPRERECFTKTVYLPFENMTVPAPIGYDKLLKSRYGDYSVYQKFSGAHNDIFIDPDTPYTYYMQHPGQIKSGNKL